MQGAVAGLKRSAGGGGGLCLHHHDAVLVALDKLKVVFPLVPDGTFGRRCGIARGRELSTDPTRRDAAY